MGSVVTFAELSVPLSELVKFITPVIPQVECDNYKRYLKHHDTALNTLSLEIKASSRATRMANTLLRHNSDGIPFTRKCINSTDCPDCPSALFCNIQNCIRVYCSHCQHMFIVTSRGWGKGRYPPFGITDSGETVQWVSAPDHRCPAEAYTPVVCPTCVEKEMASALFSGLHRPERTNAWVSALAVYISGVVVGQGGPLGELVHLLSLNIAECPSWVVESPR